MTDSRSVLLRGAAWSPIPADALCAARVKYGVERRRGGLLPWFILYDVCAIIVIVIAYTAQIGWLLSHGAPSWIIWTKLYYAKLMCALADFSFVIDNLQPEALNPKP